MKEELDLIWEQDNREQAEKVLGSWVAKAFACGVPRLKKFANSLLAYDQEFLHGMIIPYQLVL